ncbi:hypothetical protein Trydic_g21410 [Trypoxylus dichotomus]
MIRDQLWELYETLPELITTSTEPSPSIFIDLITSSRNGYSNSESAETNENETNQPTPFIRRSAEIAHKPPLGAFVLNFLKYNKPQMNKQGLLQRLLAGKKQEPYSDLLVRKLMNMDKKQVITEPPPPPIFDIASQLRGGLTKCKYYMNSFPLHTFLLNSSILRAFYDSSDDTDILPIIQIQDNVLESFKNIVLSLLTKVDTYFLEVVKNLIFNYIMRYQNNFLEGVKNKALQFIAKQEMNAFNRVKDGTQHVIEDQKEHVLGGIKRNIFACK